MSSLVTLPFKNKVAFITGASRGIGQACAIALAEAGAHCVLSARTQGGLIQTDNIIRQKGGKATLFPFDLQPKNPFDTTIDNIGPSIAQQFHRLDIFIHAAFHYTPLTPVDQITDKDWSKNISINFTSCMKLVRTLSPLLCATPNSQALFLQGITKPAAFWGSVTSVQAAIQNLINCWKEEIKDISTVHVQTITPPPTKTLLRQSFFPAEDKDKLNSPEKTAKIILAFLLKKQNP